jgi:probable LLM family oxidoreductase
MQLGISSFAETTPDPKTGAVQSHAERLREIVEEIVLAEKVGLDVYGLGEHHRPDYASSSPAVVLAAAASRTERIRLSSAVTVLSSADPVRVFQDFATLDGLSNGRAEIMAGRGSFIESFPLFGQKLDDYEELFSQNLELLLELQKSERVTWRGGHRPAIDNRGIYPRPVQDPLPVWIASGGNRESVVRAATLGLPLALAIIGGRPEQFAPLVQIYKRVGHNAGHAPEKLQVAVHSHGFVAQSSEEAAELFFPSTQIAMNTIGRERGWQPYTRDSFEAARSPRGALFAGSVEEVADKILLMRANLGIDRFFLHVPVGSMPHQQVMGAIELFGREVAPRVRSEIGSAQ